MPYYRAHWVNAIIFKLSGFTASTGACSNSSGPISCIKFQFSGLPRSGKNQGNSSFTQSQGTVREFCCKLGDFVIFNQSQGKIWEFRLWSLSINIYHCLVHGIWTRTKPKLFGIFFSKLHLFSWFGTTYWTFSWCLKHSLVHTYFQDHFIEASIDELCSFYVVLFIMYIATSHHRVYIATVTGSCVGSQGKLGNFFFCRPHGNPDYVRNIFVCWLNLWDHNGNWDWQFGTAMQADPGLRPVDAALRITVRNLA